MENKLQIKPLTIENWSAFEELFGANGACGGCWCMHWRMKRLEYEKLGAEGRHQAMKKLVSSGTIPGLLGFMQNEPVAWCSLGPRHNFSVLSRSRILKPVDEQDVWSIVCFFIKTSWRHKGFSRQMITGAIDYARSNGVKILEAYPIDPKKKETPAVFAWTGLMSAFLKTGFVEVARRSETRPIMRCQLT